MEIRLEHITKAWQGRPVLSDLTAVLSAPATAVMAPSGTGKTTLLRLILGLDTPDSGRIVQEGISRTAAVFQEDRLLLHRPALENLYFVQGRSRDRAQATALLEKLGLADAMDRPVRAFSGGMKRRLALARALSVSADLLVLDEPFSGLDVENRRRCLDVIRESSAMVILATHDIRDAEALQAEILSL